MIRLAFSTNAYKKNTLEEAIASIGAIGYRGVEIMADVPHAYPPRLPHEKLEAVRRQIAAPGMAASNVNAFTLFACGDTYHPTWIEDDPRAAPVASNIHWTRLNWRLGLERRPSVFSLADR